MAHYEKFNTRRHPLCTCPEWEPNFEGIPQPDRSKCAGGDVAHPVLDADAIEQVLGPAREALQRLKNEVRSRTANSVRDLPVDFGFPRVPAVQVDLPLVVWDRSTYADQQVRTVVTELLIEINRLRRAIDDGRTCDCPCQNADGASDAGTGGEPD
jgi:hypothetical protein